MINGDLPTRAAGLRWTHLGGCGTRAGRPGLRGHGTGGDGPPRIDFGGAAVAGEPQQPLDPQRPGPALLEHLRVVLPPQRAHPRGRVEGEHRLAGQRVRAERIRHGLHGRVDRGLVAHHRARVHHHLQRLVDHDWTYWAAYLAQRRMSLGVYYNPLWVHRAAVEDQTKTVAGRPDVKIADIVDQGDFFARDIGGNTLYWVDVTKPGAREYVQGYVEYFKAMGVPYLRVDFLSWYENGMDANIGQVNAAHGRENYLTALHWMNEAAGDSMEVSLVMPHLFDNASAELANGDLVRINADADKGGWDRLSGGRQGWQNAWPNWFNPFCGYT